MAVLLKASKKPRDYDEKSMDLRIDSIDPKRTTSLSLKQTEKEGKGKHRNKVKETRTVIFPLVRYRNGLTGIL